MSIICKQCSPTKFCLHSAELYTYYNAFVAKTFYCLYNLLSIDLIQALFDPVRFSESEEESAAEVYTYMMFTRFLTESGMGTC